MRIKPTNFNILICFFFLFSLTGFSQQNNKPEMAAGSIEGNIKLDGLLDDPGWANAPVNDQFKTIVPAEGGIPSGKTEVRV